ncbi:MAG: hypothetical protein NPIRA03_26850 [Nitrospirales bacterium]|nr:MAG: hypothetical protein NPIRA03_26850 [Nitrospirales bacterium]
MPFLSPFRLTLRIFVVAIVAFHVFGCAIYYRDAESGAEHIWGFGHLAMKATPPLDGKQALIRKSTMAGVAVGVDDGSLGLSIGWDQRERLMIYDENTAVTIQRPPSNDFFYFKVGSYPLEFNPTKSTDQHSSEAKEDQP